MTVSPENRPCFRCEYLGVDGGGEDSPTAAWCKHPDAKRLAKADDVMKRVYGHEDKIVFIGLKERRMNPADPCGPDGLQFVERIPLRVKAWQRVKYWAFIARAIMRPDIRTTPSKKDR